MRNAHTVLIISAVIIAIALLAGILFGAREPLPKSIGADQSVRDVALALWTFLIPAWFMVESAWFTPPEEDPSALKRFLAAQNAARLTWTVVGGAVAIVIGATAPDLQVQKDASSKPNVVSSQSTTN